MPDDNNNKIRQLCAQPCVPSPVCSALCAQPCVPSPVCSALGAQPCVPSPGCSALGAQPWVLSPVFSAPQGNHSLSHPGCASASAVYKPELCGLEMFFDRIWVTQLREDRARTQQLVCPTPESFCLAPRPPHL